MSEVVAGRVTHADDTAERRASEAMLKVRSKAAGRRITAGEDKACDTADHVANLRAIGVTPHVTQNQAVTKTARPATAPTTNEPRGIRGTACRSHAGAMVECIFGGGKQHGTMRKTKHRSMGRVAADFMLSLIAYNLIRIPKLLSAWPPRVREFATKLKIYIQLHRAAPTMAARKENSQFQEFSADCQWAVPRGV